MLRDCNMIYLNDFTYFVNIVYDIQNMLNFGYTYNEIETKCRKEQFMLYFKNKKTKHWNLGIWAVGKDWNIKSEYIDHNGEVTTYKGGYGEDVYKPLTISVFVLHDFVYDKFRPTYSDKEFLIEKEDTEISVCNIVHELKEIFNNPIDSWHTVADHYKQNKGNKYIDYITSYYGNIIQPYYRKVRNRITGYICTGIIKTISRYDKDVYHVEHKFHEDKWNAEYEIAIVLKEKDTDYKSWKKYNFYHNMYLKMWKFTNMNIDLAISYIHDDGTFDKDIYRGVYWSEIPDKDE